MVTYCFLMFSRGKEDCDMKRVNSLYAFDIPSTGSTPRLDIPKLGIYLAYFYHMEFGEYQP